MNGIYNFTLPYELPSLNEWSKWHWAKQAKERKKYEAEFLVQKMNDFGMQRYVIFPIKRCSIIVKSYRFSLITDPDNRIVKGLLDALVNQGIIEDDNDRVIGKLDYQQFVDRKNRRTEIEITVEERTQDKKYLEYIKTK